MKLRQQSYRFTKLMQHVLYMSLKIQFRIKKHFLNFRFGNAGYEVLEKLSYNQNVVETSKQFGRIAHKNLTITNTSLSVTSR